MKASKSKRVALLIETLRAYDRILKVARTIADLANSENILSEYISK
jgi:predicted ATPase with chaperone activity